MQLDIESIKRKLLIKYPLFGMVVANTEFTVDSSIDTADTNGKKIRYNPKYISSLTEDEQIFIFAHEISHIALDHIPKCKNKDIDIWNIATDAVINANLVNDGLSQPPNLVEIPNAIEYDAEELYKKLLKENKNNIQNNQGQPNQNAQSTNIDQNIQNSQNNSSQNRNQEQEKTNQNNNNQDQSQNKNSTQEHSKNKRNNGPTNHSIWKEALEEMERDSNRDNQNTNNSEDINETNNKNDKTSLFDKLFNRNKKKENKDKEETEQSEQKQDEEKEKYRHQIDKISNMGEKQVFKQNKINKKKRLEELKKALAEKSHSFGTESANEIIKITDIGVSSSLIDWRTLLKEATKHDIDWSYQNAQIEDGVVTPYLEEFPKPETEILLDTSGSINETLLRNFLRECKIILQNSRVKVGCFDTRFYGFTEIRNESDIDSMQFIGRGGTNFNAAVNAFTKRVENKIIFTDGQAPMPNSAIDAIWIVFGENQINPKGGRVIYITTEQLNQLCLYQSSIKGRTR